MMTRRLPSGVHMPLRHLALCLDCEECFEIGSNTCPACGSATWTSLSRFLGEPDLVEASQAVP
jgi:rRNA maturation endonuclease Nob1